MAGIAATTSSGVADVFVIHAREYREIALTMRVRLRRKGVETFVDCRSVEDGADLHDEIANAIRRCKLAVFLIAPEALEGYCLRELELFEREHPDPAGCLLPVMVGAPSENIPPYLALIKHLHPRGDVVEETVEAVLRMLNVTQHTQTGHTAGALRSRSPWSWPSGQIAPPELKQDEAPNDGRRFATVHELIALREELAHGNGSPQHEKALACLNWGAHIDASMYLRTFGPMLADTQRGDAQPRFRGLYCPRDGAKKKWIWYAWDVREKRVVLVKELALWQSDANAAARLTWEIELYKQLEGMPGIPRLLGWGEGWFATELAAYGDLKRVLDPASHDSGDVRLAIQAAVFDAAPLVKPSHGHQWRVFLDYFAQAAWVLGKLHERGIVHRDVRRENLLVGRAPRARNELVAMCCDLDRAISVHESVLPQYLNVPAEALYVAPERNYATGPERHGVPASDVHDLAAILTETLVDFYKDGDARRRHELRKQALLRSRTVPDRLKDILSEGLAWDPEDRPSAKELSRQLRELSETFVDDDDESSFALGSTGTFHFDDAPAPTSRWAALQKLVSGLPLVSGIVCALVVLAAVLYARTVDPSTNVHEHVLAGSIRGSRRLVHGETYFLDGPVELLPGSELYIEPGVHIRGIKRAGLHSSLIVHPGARIVAKGTPDEPIVFTSDQPVGAAAPGDWVGLIILGNAPIVKTADPARDPEVAARCGSPRSAVFEGCDADPAGGPDAVCCYGGDAAHDSSGVLSYVRIEFAGRVIDRGKGWDVNGLTLAGVGDGTVLNHISVLHSMDDCFEFFGGTANADHLVCADAADDAFDWDQGYDGKLSYLLMRGGPYIDARRDERGRHGLEGGDPLADFVTTGPRIDHVTICASPSSSDRPGGFVNFGISFTPDTRPTIRNILVSGMDRGWPDVIVADRSWIDLDHEATFSDEGDSFERLGCRNGAMTYKPPRALTARAQCEAWSDDCYVGAFRDESDDWEFPWAFGL